MWHCSTVLTNTGHQILDSKMHITFTRDIIEISNVIGAMVNIIVTSVSGNSKWRSSLPKVFYGTIKED